MPQMENHERGLSSPLVDFACIGVRAGGSGRLKNLLRAQSRVELAGRSEDGARPARFFDTTEHFTKGGLRLTEAALGVLDSLFPRNRTHRGIVAPTAFASDVVLKRLFLCNPDLRLVALLRNPYLRAYEAWRAEVAAGREILPFLDALKNEGDRDWTPGDRPLGHASYLAEGAYGVRIRRICALFPEENCLFVKAERMRDDPDALMAEVSAFLGLGSIAARAVSPPDRPIFDDEAPPEDAADYMRQIYEGQIDETENLLGWDCKDWRDPRASDDAAVKVA